MHLTAFPNPGAQEAITPPAYGFGTTAPVAPLGYYTVANLCCNYRTVYYAFYQLRLHGWQQVHGADGSTSWLYAGLFGVFAVAVIMNYGVTMLLVPTMLT